MGAIVSDTAGLIIGGGSAFAVEAAGVFLFARYLARRSFAPSPSIYPPCANCGEPVGSRSYDECNRCQAHRVADAYEAVAADLHERIRAQLTELGAAQDAW